MDGERPRGVEGEIENTMRDDCEGILDSESLETKKDVGYSFVEAFSFLHDDLTSGLEMNECVNERPRTPPSLPYPSTN